jgi:hypothetical protein
LVASEHALSAADRLQLLLDESDELEQRAELKPRIVYNLEFGARLLRHPDGNVDALAARGLQGVGGGWPLTALSDPETLAGEGMEAVVDPDATITGSLL